MEEMQEYKNDNIININDHECLKELIKLANKIFILSEKEGKIEKRLALRDKICHNGRVV